MTWILTYTGKKFFPLADEPGEIDLRDIAHSLALQCRYNGHCRQFYSVAEHSVRVSHVVPSADAAWGLLHDAAEAYVSDLPRPLKRTVPDFRAAEERLLRQIAETFGLPWPMPRAVHHADEVLLATEVRDLMAPLADDWQFTAAPLAETVTPISPTDAEALFLARAAALGVRNPR
jgi:hypothetical protein